MEEIRNSLIEQLRLKRADIKAFEKMIDDYMALYEIAEELKRNIKAKGTMIAEFTQKGTPVIKSNPAVKEFRDTNKQMLAILKQLNLSVDTVRVVSDDDEL